MNELKVEEFKVKDISDEEYLKKLNMVLGLGISKHDQVISGVDTVYHFLVKLSKESLSEYKKEVLTEAINKIEKFAGERGWNKWLN